MAIWQGLKRFGLQPKIMPKSSGDGPGTKCEGCEELLVKKTLDENLGVCPHCDYHHKIPVRRRAEILLDQGTFEERYGNLVSNDPLSFKALKSYEEKFSRYRKVLKEPDALLCGTGKLSGRKVAFAASDGFLHKEQWVQL